MYKHIAMIYEFTIDNNDTLSKIEDTYIDIYNQLVDYRDDIIKTNITYNNIINLCSYNNLESYITNHKDYSIWLTVFNKSMINEVIKSFINNNLLAFSRDNGITGTPIKQLPGKITRIQKINLYGSMKEDCNNIYLFKDLCVIPKHIYKDNKYIQTYKIHYINKYINYNNKNNKIFLELYKTYKKYYIFVYIKNSIFNIKEREYKNRKTVIKFDKSKYGFIKNMSNKQYSLNVNLTRIANKIKKLYDNERISKTSRYTSKEIIININIKLNVLLLERYYSLLNRLITKYDIIYISKYFVNKLPLSLNYIKAIRDMYFTLPINIKYLYSRFKCISKNNNKNNINFNAIVINTDDYTIFRCKKCNNLNVLHTRMLKSSNLYCLYCNQNKYTYMKGIKIDV